MVSHFCNASFLFNFCPFSWPLAIVFYCVELPWQKVDDGDAAGLAAGYLLGCSAAAPVIFVAGGTVHI